MNQLKYCKQVQTKGWVRIPLRIELIAMLVEAVYAHFVTCCIVILEIGVIKWEYCGHKELHTVCQKYTERLSAFKQCQLLLKHSSVYQERIPHSITPPPPPPA